MSLERLLHYVSLDGAGGVEQQFVDFVHAARQLSRARHAVVACGRGIHPLVAARLDEDVPVVFEKYAGGVKLPKWPRALRRQRQRHIVARNRPDVVLIWNRLRDSLDTLAAAGAERCIYWERGASWFAGESPAKRDFLAAVPAIICNSHAAQRMLELRWEYAGQVRVIHNALRPSLLPAAPPEPRQRPAGQPQGRFPARQMHHFHIAPEHALAKAGAQSLGAGFLRRKHLGIARRAARRPAPVGPATFLFGIKAMREPLPKPFQRLTDPANIAQIRADADNHSTLSPLPRRALRIRRSSRLAR